MLRYYIFATFFVLIVVTIVTSGMHRFGVKIKNVSVHASIPPPWLSLRDALKAEKLPFRGDAPWALSALPECFTQLSESKGNYAYAHAHLPAKRQRLQAGAQIAVHNCRIEVRKSDILVLRGPDRLRIPPPVRLYAQGTHLWVLRKTKDGATLRSYGRANTP